MASPPQPSHAWKYILGLGFVLVIISGAAVYMYYGATPTVETKSPWSTYEGVQQNNLDFREGEALLAQKKYAEAEAKFVSALPGAHSAEEEAEIAYKVAQSVSMSGDYLRAVTLYKEIAENTSYPRIVRAYAVQNMAQLYYRYADPKITESIFATEPYKSARAAGDTALSYRRLYEYSATLYPLALPELMIADWYSLKLISASDSGTPLDAATMTSYKKIIGERLRLAETDITRITNSPEQAALPNILARKALVASRMQLLGDNSFGDAQTIYEQSLNLARATGTQYEDGFTRFFYASFLSRMTGKEGGVAAILAPLYTDPGYKGSSAERFFAKEKGNILNSKKSLVRLAGIDPKFKAYLISLGWTAADFK